MFTMKQFSFRVKDFKRFKKCSRNSISTASTTIVRFRFCVQTNKSWNSNGLALQHTKDTNSIIVVKRLRFFMKVTLKNSLKSFENLQIKIFKMKTKENQCSISKRSWKCSKKKIRKTTCFQDFKFTAYQGRRKEFKSGEAEGLSMLNFARKSRKILYFAQKWGGWSLPSLPVSAEPGLRT